MAKLFDPAIMVDVSADLRGEPTGFRYRGKLQTVRGISRRWRVSQGWWRQQVAREYFQVATSCLVAVIYRDLNTGNWYLQRIYD